MIRISITLFLAALAAALVTPDAAAEEVVAFRVGKVLTMDGDERVLNNATVLVRDGKIAAVGKNSEVEVPENARRVEMPEHWLVPGFVELHNHEMGSLSDLNDTVYLTNPGLRSLEALLNDERMLDKGRAGGVTAALAIPGSGSNMGGFGAVMKYRKGSIEDLLVKTPGSIKIAQAGNPERYWYGVGRRFMNYNTRQTLLEGLEYHQAWEAYEAGESAAPPPRSLNFEDFRGLYRREYPASVHTQSFQLVMTTVNMLARDMKVRTVLDHSTFDGWKVAPLVLEVGEENIITMNGPRQFYPDFAQRKMFGNAARWWQGGIRKLGINTDSPVVPQEELSYQAAMACWYGWTPYEAVAGLTRVGAEAVMLEDRIGSIETGKDADFGLWTGDPIDPRSACEMTIVDGEVVYDANDEQVF